MTLNDDDRKQLVGIRMEKAFQAEKEVEFLITHEMLHLAVNRIYYGIFYMLSALSLHNRVSVSKHQRLIGWFNQTFIKTGLLDRKYGKLVHTAFDKRMTGDYSDLVQFSNDEVRSLQAEMHDFLIAIKGFMLGTVNSSSSTRVLE